MRIKLGRSHDEKIRYLKTWHKSFCIWPRVVKSDNGGSELIWGEKVARCLEQWVENAFCPPCHWVTFSIFRYKFVYKLLDDYIGDDAPISEKDYIYEWNGIGFNKANILAKEYVESKKVRDKVPAVQNAYEAYRMLLKLGHDSED